MKPVIFDNFERGIPSFFTAAIACSLQGRFSCCRTQDIINNLLHDTSADDHASRMTFVISGSFRRRYLLQYSQQHNAPP